MAAVALSTCSRVQKLTISPGRRRGQGGGRSGPQRRWRASAVRRAVCAVAFRKSVGLARRLTLMTDNNGHFYKVVGQSSLQPFRSPAPVPIVVRICRSIALCPLCSALNRLLRPLPTYFLPARPLAALYSSPPAIPGFCLHHATFPPQ